MLDLLKDKNLLLPIVEKTDILYKKYKITPNAITLFNSLYVTNIILHQWIISNYYTSFLFLMIRLVLDGSDGYIARKYNLYSKEGEIYDHISDSIFLGYIYSTFAFKYGIPIEYVFLIGHTVMICSMIINYNKHLIFLSEKIFGGGGSYEAYCTLNYLMAHFTIMLIDIYS